MPSATNTWLNKIAKEKTTLLDELFRMEPRHVDVKDPITKKILPREQGEDIVYLWDKLYACDPMMREIVVQTATGPSTPGKDYYDAPDANPAYPYQQLRALVGDGGRWKWPEIWKNLDLLPRRGRAWRHLDDPSNLGVIANPAPHAVPLKCLVVGGGPVGCRLAIELALGGHRVAVWEKRREALDSKSGLFESVGFTNRINRPHIKNFCRNDLDRLNGRNFMTAKACYPVFTNVHTSSIGIDECQMLLLKTALLLGVEFQLGMSYEDAEVDVEHERNQRPSWMVRFQADGRAQDRYGRPATGTERFDALFGCDGGQSKVRSTQAVWLGTPKIRCYKKMFGIVSNLRKVSRKKLKEMGFGLEPDDRGNINEGIFFYKASYHNYFIVHPHKDELEANGIPWKQVFTYEKANAEKNEDKDKMKRILKKYMTKKAHELNLPIDTSLENGGFVDAPNDVMSFDFSEFYNAEKSAACFVPPLDWDLERDGEWEIQCPLVALAGDAVADPNWILGVGLQRGWTAAMDAVFYADTLYNNKTFNGKPPVQNAPAAEPVEWMDHMDNLTNLIQNLSDFSRAGKLSSEMIVGLLDEKGPVINQIRRRLKAKETIPQYQIPVEPWGRYKEFTHDINKQYKGRLLFENVHPLTTREVAIFNHHEEWVELGDKIKRKVRRPTPAMLTWPKRFTCSAFWGMMPLLQIDGKTPPGVEPLKKAEAEEKDEEDQEDEEEEMPTAPKVDIGELRRLSLKKSNSLRENALKLALQGPKPQQPSSRPVQPFPNQMLQSPPDAHPPLRGDVETFSLSTKKHLLYSIHSGQPAALYKTDNYASSADNAATPTSLGLDMLSTCNDANDPLEQAKLQYVRNEQEALCARLAAIQKETEMLQKSLAAYQEAEARLLAKQK